MTPEEINLWACFDSLAEYGFEIDQLERRAKKLGITWTARRTV